MRWWDVEEVAALEREVFVEDPWSAAGFWSELAGVPETRSYVVAELAAGAPGAETGSNLAGYAGLMVGGVEADIQTVAVRPDQRGTGLGRTLTEWLVDEARSRSCTRVMLEVRDGNNPARRLYTRLGFEPVGRRADYYGRGRDAVVMRLPLERPAP
jgi:[ribosomal protein S18]-alanine N-acetyltransferase